MAQPLRDVEERREVQTYGKYFIGDSDFVHANETPGRAAFNRSTRKVLDTDRQRSDDCNGNESSGLIARIILQDRLNFTDIRHYARRFDIAKKSTNIHSAEDTADVNGHRLW